jgi:hypothetical protein
MNTCGVSANSTQQQFGANTSNGIISAYTPAK